MRIYLDTCALNRPFDPKSNVRVSEEAAFIRSILDRITEGKIELVWSSALDFEIAQNPSLERREQIKKWGNFAILDIEETQNVLDGSKSLIKSGL